MDKIFCLETEWTKNVHDLKSQSQVKYLLDFVNQCEDMRIPYVFRQVATLSDFDYYMNHLQYPSYNGYDMIYLCFHGTPGVIHFANRDQLSLLELSERYSRLTFTTRHVHFDSCFTLLSDEDEILMFKKKTGARIVSGYQKSVPFAESFIFELWLIRTVQLHPAMSAKMLNERAQKEMPEYVKKLKFVAF